jgi:hypothetical protein
LRFKKVGRAACFQKKNTKEKKKENRKKMRERERERERKAFAMISKVFF